MVNMAENNISRRSRQQRRRAKETLAALIVIGAMLACMAAVVISLSFADGGADMPVRQTAGTPIRVESSSQQDAYTRQDVRPEESDFQQLSDPFLVLVNDEVQLPENWEVTPSFIGEEAVDIRVYDQLSAMMRAAQEDGVSLWICSGYRSVEEQEIILNREIEQHMNSGMSEEEARELSLRTIARPGHSEHHTGFVVDLNDVDDAFEETDAYRWLSEYAEDYGFVQRYRSDKVDITGIDNESWHYRYVGAENAREMNRLNMCLEEYVQYLKDQGVA
jgi:D-alanyl-D-alanine carboxypeptidase